MNGETLGARIARLRKEQGMTQLELAERMGVTDKAVSKWERGVSFPDIASFPRLAEIFHVSTDDLLQAAKRKPSTVPNIRESLSLILRCVAVAMGVAAAVLAALGELEAQKGMTLLGIGLACIAVWALEERK
jgi:transcriptional regulator with XRE-family HTH domain